MGSADTPPWWSPELESDSLYPYTLAEWTKDIRRWMGATRASPERQGPIIALSLGNTARTIVDEVSDEILQNGATLDLGDGLGVTTRSGVDIILAVLRNKFPPDAEALMLRAGLDFFGFTPSREEELRSMFLRFDLMLGRANQATELNQLPFSCLDGLVAPSFAA